MHRLRLVRGRLSHPVPGHGRAAALAAAPGRLYLVRRLRVRVPAGGAGPRQDRRRLSKIPTAWTTASPCNARCRWRERNCSTSFATLFFALFIPVIELFMLGYAIDTKRAQRPHRRTRPVPHRGKPAAAQVVREHRGLQDRRRGLVRRGPEPGDRRRRSPGRHQDSRSTKLETNPKQEIPNSKSRTRFGFRVSDLFRISRFEFSDLGIRPRR